MTRSAKQDATRGPRRRAWLFRLAALSLSLAACELVLQVASWASPTVRGALLPEYLRDTAAAGSVSPTVPDPIVGWRGNPACGMFDSAGFPNRAALGRVDVVVIGDSQTQCPLGEPDRTWPAVLGRITDHSTYNMGIGGWGPVDYLSVLDEALAHEPRVVLIGIYLGNDLFDAYRVAYHRHQRQDLATPEAAGAIAAAEADAPIHDEMLEQFTSAGGGHHGGPSDGTTGIRGVLSRHGKLYGLARLARDYIAGQLMPERVEEAKRQRAWRQQVDWAARHPDQGCVFERDRLRTILTPARRNMALDLEDPRIAEGLAISLRAIDECDRRCREAGAAFGIVLIPTKETAFWAAAEHGDADRGLAELVANEEAVRGRIIAFLDTLGIAHVDARASLADRLASGCQPYPITRDGHPNEVGYEAIAVAAAELLRPGRPAMGD